MRNVIAEFKSYSPFFITPFINTTLSKVSEHPCGPQEPCHIPKALIFLLMLNSQSITREHFRITSNEENSRAAI